MKVGNVIDLYPSPDWDWYNFINGCFREVEATVSETIYQQLYFDDIAFTDGLDNLIS